MDIIIHQFAFCFIIPLIFVCFLLEKDSRMLVIALAIGAFQGMVSLTFVDCIKEIENDIDYVMITYMPSFVELFKAIPVLFYAMVYKKSFKDIFNVSVVLATGFAVIESVSLIDISYIDFIYIITHIVVYILINVVCSVLVGTGIFYILEKGKIFLLGIFGLYLTSVTLHAIIYIMQITKHHLLSVISVIIIYIPITIYYYLMKRKERIKNRI